MRQEPVGGQVRLQMQILYLAVGVFAVANAFAQGLPIFDKEIRTRRLLEILSDSKSPLRRRSLQELTQMGPPSRLLTTSLVEIVLSEPYGAISYDVLQALRTNVHLSYPLITNVYSSTKNSESRNESLAVLLTARPLDSEKGLKYLEASFRGSQVGSVMNLSQEILRSTIQDKPGRLFGSGLYKPEIVTRILLQSDRPDAISKGDFGDMFRMLRENDEQSVYCAILFVKRLRIDPALRSLALQWATQMRENCSSAVGKPNKGAIILALNYILCILEPSTAQTTHDSMLLDIGKVVALDRGSTALLYLLLACLPDPNENSRVLNSLGAENDSVKVGACRVAACIGVFAQEGAGKLFELVRSGRTDIVRREAAIALGNIISNYDQFHKMETLMNVERDPAAKLNLRVAMKKALLEN
jgi:hypothetical protein